MTEPTKDAGTQHTEGEFGTTVQTTEEKKLDEELAKELLDLAEKAGGGNKGRREKLRGQHYTRSRW